MLVWLEKLLTVLKWKINGEPNNDALIKNKVYLNWKANWESMKHVETMLPFFLQ